MTKKHYKLIAQAIKDTNGFDGCAKRIAEALAKALAQDNPRFNRSIFLEACGVS